MNQTLPRPHGPAHSHRSVAALLALCAPLLVQCGGSDDDGDTMPPPDPATIAIVDAYPELSFDQPLFYSSAPGNDQQVFVVTQTGIIYRFVNDATVQTADVFLDISDRVTASGEMGLLGLAFDPGYADNGHFYVNYVTGTALTRRTVISRFAIGDSGNGDPESETPLLEYAQPFANHNGGWIGFGPDGRLYIASGDGGSAGDPNDNAQSLDTLLGKILRINADGSVPDNNPFVNDPQARPEIWAYGLRNPYRASFDRLDGTLWAADVGQGAREEIDIITRGGNYGWRKYEGTQVYNATDPEPADAIDPVFEYDHSNGRCSITGGYVYRGSALDGYHGAYLYADYCSGELWSLTRNDDGSYTSTALGEVPGRPTSFGEDADGELYITSFDGKVYKLVPADV